MCSMNRNKNNAVYNSTSCLIFSLHPQHLSFYVLFYVVFQLGNDWEYLVIHCVHIKKIANTLFILKKCMLFEAFGFPDIQDSTDTWTEVYSQEWGKHAQVGGQNREPEVGAIYSLEYVVALAVTTQRTGTTSDFHPISTTFSDFQCNHQQNDADNYNFHSFQTGNVSVLHHGQMQTTFSATKRVLSTWLKVFLCPQVVHLLTSHAVIQDHPSNMKKRMQRERRTIDPVVCKGIAFSCVKTCLQTTL